MRPARSDVRGPVGSEQSAPRARPVRAMRTAGAAGAMSKRFIIGDIPVVASTQAAFWAALRLVGASGHPAGCGPMLEESVIQVH